jgi:4-amino-4-deoxy-L-arabinose transferase-like glycosyltransferase
MKKDITQMKVVMDFITSKEGNARKDLGILFLLFGAAFFQFLGRIPLLEPDEGRYAEIPREMLARADFITPYLNYVKYFEKPPLLYWLNSISFSIFGQNEFAARFFPALSGLLTVLLTYHIGRKIYGRREGILAALVLGASAGFLAQARMNIIDMPLTLCMTATLGFFLLAAREDEKCKGLYYYLFYVFAALTVLAKGLIGMVLPGGIIFFFIVLTRRWKILREMKIVTGSLLFLLITAPWFILVSVRNPEFARFFFIHEHVERFLTKIHGRYEPPWYFIPVLLGCMFPWTLFLPAVLRKIWREKRPAMTGPTIYLVIWAALIFCFFSLSDSKLIPYIIPVFPAVALLAGRTFSVVLDEGIGSIRINAYGAALLLVLVSLGILTYPLFAHKLKLDFDAFIVMGSILLGGGVAAFAAVRKGSAAALFASMSAMSLLLAVAGPPFIFGKLAERKATPELARIAGRDFRDGDIIACYGWYQQGLPFYTGHRVLVVDYKGELEFGSNQGDNSAWFISRAAFDSLWDSPIRLLTLIKKPDLAVLRNVAKTPVKILGQKGNIFLISNH